MMAGDARSNREVVADAIRDGKIPPARAQFWTDALDADPAGARSMLAMLTSVPDYSRPAASGRNAPSDQAGAAPTAAHPTARVETLEQMNDRVNADPEMQALAWQLGIRDGIEPPPVYYVKEPEYDSPYDPKPEMVVNDDGSIRWVAPEADHTGTMLDENIWESRYSNARGGAWESNQNRLRRQAMGEDPTPRG